MLVKVTGSVEAEDLDLALVAFPHLEMLLGRALAEVDLGADQLTLLVFAGAQELLRGRLPMVGRSRRDGQRELIMQVRFAEAVGLSSSAEQLAARIAVAAADSLEEALAKGDLARSVRGVTTSVIDALKLASTR